MGDMFAEKLRPVRTQEPHQRWRLKEELSTAVGRHFDHQVTIAQAGPVVLYFNMGPARWRFAESASWCLGYRWAQGGPHAALLSPHASTWRISLPS